MNVRDWFPLGWTGWTSFQSKGLSRVFSNTTVQKHQFFGAQLSLESNSHIHTWLLEKPLLWLDRWTFVGKVTSLLFNMLSRFVIAFLPRSKCLLITWLQSTICSDEITAIIGHMVMVQMTLKCHFPKTVFLPIEFLAFDMYAANVSL